MTQPLPTPSNHRLPSSSFFDRVETHRIHFHQNPLFQALAAGKFDEIAKGRFLFHKQVFSDQFQRLMLLRSASCTDRKLDNLFYQHLTEELGHHRLLESERTPLQIPKDMILEALCMWLPHQISLTTPLEQLVIVNYGIETAAVVIYKYAIPALDPNRQSEYFRIHEIHDEDHQTMGHEFIESCTQSQIDKLLIVLDDTWAILNAMMERICILSLND